MAWLVLLAVLGADTFRLGFFADDFHMLDVARNFPLLQLLRGEHGIFPWYRPLSREVYFALIAHAGRFELPLARLLSLACVALAAWQVHWLAARWSTPRAGVIAAVLFVCFATTKFLVAWASGFQDLLALSFVLLAVRDHVDGRAGRALLWAFLACFAKETAVLGFALLALYTFLSRPPRAAWRAWLAQLAVLAAAAAVHVVVRLAWQGGGRQVHVERSAADLAGALARVLGGFAGAVQAPEPGTVVAAGLAALATAWLMSQPHPAVPSSTVAAAVEPATSRRVPAALFLAIAAALGLAPLVVGHVLGVVTASSYYAYSAVPWLCMLLALGLVRMPRAVATVVVVGLAGWNTLALGLRAPDLREVTAWRFHDWNWTEAIRLSAIAQRFGDDLRARLSRRPDSLVVLFCNMPAGCYFQSEDGPATRESLHDATVRSWWLNGTPYGIAPDRFTILSLDAETGHLVPYRLTLPERDKLAASSIAAGEAATAWAYVHYGSAGENAGFEFHYLAAVAALMGEGPAGARRELARIGLDDTTGAAPEHWATLVVGSAGPLHAPMLGALRHPLDARSHLALADASRDAQLGVFEAVELRFATTLDPSLMAARLRLAKSLFTRGKPAAARRDLERLIGDARGGSVEREARAMLQQVEREPPPEAAPPGN